MEHLDSLESSLKTTDIDNNENDPNSSNVNKNNNNFDQDITNKIDNQSTVLTNNVDKSNKFSMITVNNNNNNPQFSASSGSLSSSRPPRFVVRLRGLPWNAREQDIQNFFKEEKLKEIQVVFLIDGRASGEALVEFEKMEDYQSALLKNRRHIGHRYIEIFKSTSAEIDTVAGRTLKPVARSPQSQYVIRLRGLPYSATDNDIINFFRPTIPNTIHLIKDDMGRPSGESFVEFKNEYDALEAMSKNRYHMGHRYIELFRSSTEELTRVLSLNNAWSSNSHSNNNNNQNHDIPIAIINNSNINVNTNTNMNTNTNTNININVHSNPVKQNKNETYEQKNILHKINMNDNNDSQNNHIRSCCVLMRGLPYTCTESDLTKFFQEADVTPVRIHRKADGAEAYIEFYSISDADKAMTKQRGYIGRRYIELFRVTYEDMARTVGLPLTPMIDITNILNNATKINSNNITQQTNVTGSMIPISLKSNHFPLRNHTNTNNTINNYTYPTNNLSSLQTLISLGNDLKMQQMSPQGNIQSSIHDYSATSNTTCYNNNNTPALNLFNHLSPYNINTTTTTTTTTAVNSNANVNTNTNNPYLQQSLYSNTHNNVNRQDILSNDYSYTNSYK